MEVEEEVTGCKKLTFYYLVIFYFSINYTAFYSGGAGGAWADRYWSGGGGGSYNSGSSQISESDNREGHGMVTISLVA